MSKSEKEVNEKLEKDKIDLPNKFGNKAANLIKLQQLCVTLPDVLKEKVAVPPIFPIENDLVYKYLDQYTMIAGEQPASGSQITPYWRILWGDFVKAQGNNKNEITKEGREILEKLRQLILKTFEEKPFPLGDIQKKLTGTETVMVRSTGKEDTVDVTNPGGNESSPALMDPASISAAMGVTVASYFSEKSLNQRLISKKDNITDPPFLPVLIQQMIGESHHKKTDMVYSGVMYVGENESDVTVQIAPGHGALVVDAETPLVDTYCISEENVVTSEIHEKPYRYVPKLIDIDKKKQLSLEKTKNSQNLSKNPSLNSTTALRLAEIGRKIQQHNQHSTDIEFVYSPKDDKIYLVQERPFSDGDVRTLKPTSVPPDKLMAVQQFGKPIKGATICTGNLPGKGGVSAVITKPEEIIICRDINTALKIFSSEANSKVKAVAIEEEALITSHAAAEFNTKGIKIIQVKNIKEVENWMKEPKPVIVFDTQRKQIFNWTKQIRNHAEAEKEMFETGVLKVGLFESPTPPRVTLMPFENELGKIKIDATVSSASATAAISAASAIPTASATSAASANVNKKNTETEKLGDLLASLNSKEIDKSVAFNKLMKRLYALIPAAAWKKSKDKTETVYTNMLAALSKLKAADFSKDNKEALEALNTILIGFYRLAASKGSVDAVHKRLFRHAFIKGAEIRQSLERLSSSANFSETKQNVLKQQHLNLVARLEALINNPGMEMLFSNSIRQIAQMRAEQRIASRVKGSEQLTSLQFKFFVELLKFKKYALNQKIAGAWEKFCLACCKELPYQDLIRVVKFFQENALGSEWLNNNFISQYERVTATKNDFTIVDAKTLLQILQTEAIQVEEELMKIKFEEMRSTIKNWENKIEEWAKSKNFDKLWKQYEEELMPLIDEINFSPNMSALSKRATLTLIHNLTTVMDNSIKSLKGSPEYERDRKLQIQHFSKMLDPFLKLMSKWVLLVPKQKMSFGGSGYGNILAEIKKRLDFLKNSTDEKILHTTGTFPQVATLFDGTVMAVVRNLEKLSLEDLYTMMHQNILISLGLLKEDIGNSTKYLPEQLESLIKELSDVKIYSMMFSSGMTLVNVEHQFPRFQLDYNICLSAHSIRCSVQYDQNQRKCQLGVMMYESGGFIGNRFKELADVAKLSDLFLEGTTCFVKQNLIDKSILEFSFTIDGNQLGQQARKIKDVTMGIVDLTMGDPRRKKPKYFENLFSNLSLDSDNKASNTVERLIAASNDPQYQFLKKDWYFWCELIEIMKKFSNTKEMDAVSRNFLEKDPTVLSSMKAFVELEKTKDPNYVDEEEKKWLAKLSNNIAFLEERAATYKMSEPFSAAAVHSTDSTASNIRPFKK